MTVTSPLPGTESPAAAEAGGLRERKKRETRRTIHRAALELALERGIEAVTVDGIAERAGVSPRTFFNYFPAKDDAIVGNAPDDLDEVVASMAALPPDLRPREVIRIISRDRVLSLEGEPELWAMRRKLVHSEPTIGLRYLGIYARADRAIVDAVTDRVRAHRSLTPEDELDVAVEAYAALGALRAAVRAYLSGGHEMSFADLVDQAFRRL